MSISRKIVLFFSLVAVASVVFIYSIVQSRIQSTEKLEEQFVQKNIKKLENILQNNGKYLSKIAYEYATHDKLINLIYKRDGEALENFIGSKNNLMKQLSLSYMVFFDNKKNYLYGNYYDISSDESFSVPYEIIDFFEKNDIKQYINLNENRYMTLGFEKVNFKIEPVMLQNRQVGYLFLARTLDSEFLTNMSEVLQEYVSLVSYYKNASVKTLKFFKREIPYDIQRKHEQLLSFLKLHDEGEKEAFYVRLQGERTLYFELVSEIKYSLYSFAFAFVILALIFFLFMNRLFTSRIQYITQKIKEASMNDSLLIRLKVEYNDEISYLSAKINEMFSSIYAHQDMTLKKERDFLQSVLDTQQSIILITDGTNIQSTNRKFREIFHSHESFLNNIALLDNKTRANLIAVAKKFENQEKPAKFTLTDDQKYFTFDVSRLDIKKYLICMNDVSHLNRKISNLEVKASIDELTAVYNKSTITNIAKSWLVKQNFCLIIFDIDFFKRINDEYGHFIGDCILKDLSKLISKEIPKDDIMGRFGGEEFLILVNDITNENILNIANRLRQLIEKKQFVYDGTKINITVSMGCTFCHQNEFFDNIYQRADKALYKAKENGRNQVIYH